MDRSSAACWQQCPLLLHQTLATVCESPPPLLGSCGPRTTHWISVQAAHAVKRYMLMITKRIKDYNSFNKYKKYWMYIFRCVHLFLDIHYIHSFQRDRSWRAVPVMQLRRIAVSAAETRWPCHKVVVTQPSVFPLVRALRKSCIVVCMWPRTHAVLSALLTQSED